MTASPASPCANSVARSSNTRTVAFVTSAFRSSATSRSNSGWRPSCSSTAICAGFRAMQQTIRECLGIGYALSAPDRRLRGRPDLPPLAHALHRFRPSGLRQARLCSGLVCFCYVSLHLTNHALGNVSLAVMERGLLVQKFIWQGWFGTAALYVALTMHFILGLYALYERRRLHWTPPELAQLLLGLAIPPLLANHLAVTRIAFSEFDLDKGYAQELYSFWIASPALGWLQLTLLVVAWLHGCLGIAFWLRVKPWFARLRAPLLAVAVLLPVLALLGYLQAGREVVALAQDPTWRAATTATMHTGTPQQNLWLTSLRNDFLVFDGVALAVVVLARLARAAVDRRRGRICVSYPDGRRQHVPLGFSVMEASLLAGIPHAGLCGARARCSLCRVRVLGAPSLPP